MLQCTHTHTHTQLLQQRSSSLTKMRLVLLWQKEDKELISWRFLNTLYLKQNAVTVLRLDHLRLSANFTFQSRAVSLLAAASQGADLLYYFSLLNISVDILLKLGFVVCLQHNCRSWWEQVKRTLPVMSTAAAGAVPESDFRWFNEFIWFVCVFYIWYFFYLYQ